MKSARVDRINSGHSRIFTISPRGFCGLVLISLTGFSTLRAQQLPQEQPPSTPMQTEAPHQPSAPPPTSLRDLVQEAERNNPQIAATFHAWQAATNMPRQVSALPETQVTVQQFSVGSPRPFAGYTNSEFGYIGVGASQDLPYPGKRPLRAKVAEFEANSLHEQSDSMRRDVVENVQRVYYQLAYIQQTLGTLLESDRLLEQVEKAAESRYQVGQGNQQDVLKAQLQHTKILQKIAHHHEQEGGLEAQLKQLLNRAQESPDIVTEPVSPTPVRYSAAELARRIREQNPDVRTRSEMLHSEETQVELAHKEFRPDFNLGYMYQNTDRKFRDYYMLTFSVRLPNRGRQKAELAEAEQNQERTKQELQAEIQRVLAEVQQQYVMVQTSEEQLRIYTDGLIPQANATFQAGLAAYQSNKQDFESLLSSFLDVLNLELDYQNELVAHESAVARLERLTGVSLP
jgi:cobalt-zinc-cadmium efflux system outer membrane protein